IEVDVRVLASTNQDLEGLARSGNFRSDLLFRLRVLHIALPPLRSRLEDLPPLCHAIILQFNEQHRTRVTHINALAMQSLRRHDWPGNVRELRNILERAVILAREGEINEGHLPRSFGERVEERIRRDYGAVPSITIPVGSTIAQAERE